MALQHPPAPVSQTPAHGFLPTVATGLTDQDRRRIEDALDHSVSADTRRSYASAWNSFDEWTQARGVPSLPAPAGLAGKEQVAGPGPQVLVVLPSGPSRGCWDGWTKVGQQLGGGLVETDHRPLRVIRLGVQIQDILHGGHEVGAHLRNTPLLLLPRLEGVFSTAASPSRGTTT